MTIPPPPPGAPRARGGCLTAFLVLVLIANPLVAILYLGFGASIAAMVPTMPRWGFLVMGIGAILNFVCGIGIWMRKKWGAYGFLAVSAVATVINAMTIGVGRSGSGLLGVAILLFLLRDEWKYMD